MSNIPENSMQVDGWVDHQEALKFKSLGEELLRTRTLVKVDKNTWTLKKNNKKQKS